MAIHKHILGFFLPANILIVKLKKLRLIIQLTRSLHTRKYSKTMQKKMSVAMWQRISWPWNMYGKNGINKNRLENDFYKHQIWSKRGEEEESEG